MKYLEYEIEELIPIVIRLAEKYTSKESTSITYEAAAHLMEAVQYCIREYVQEEQTTDKEEEADRQMPEVSKKKVPAELAYERGYQIVLGKVDCVRRMYHVILPNFKSYGNENYKDTFEKGIPAFLRYYNPRFAPQDPVITMDYPVLWSMEQLQGVDAVEKYVEAIRLEQRFLGKLPDEYVRRTLEEYQYDYERQFFNICNIVLRGILRRMMGENVPEPEHLERAIEGYLRILVKEQYKDSKDLLRYLGEDVKDFWVELKQR